MMLAPEFGPFLYVFDPIFYYLRRGYALKLISELTYDFRVGKWLKIVRTFDLVSEMPLSLVILVLFNIFIHFWHARD